nr:DUF3373 family protein [Candidatus Electrothrix aestuarii]
MIILPTTAMAGGEKKPSDMSDGRIEELSQQVDQLQAELAQKDEVASENDAKIKTMSDELEEMADRLEDMDDLLEEQEERAEAWDLAARFHLSGDFRSRLDYFNATGADYINPITGALESGREYSNETMFTNRFRLNMQVRATENVKFKGRLGMYKIWGMEGYARNDMNSWWPQFDGNSTRTPSDNALRVDRAYVNWTNIGGEPVWFSIGRRPTTDGSPSQIRLGVDKRMATPAAQMEYAFDGISLGYQYDWGNDSLGNGRVRFCYGRGFENGVQWDAATYYDATDLYPLDDTDLAGFSWDIIDSEDRFLYFQTFMAMNMFMRPSFQDDIVNAMMDEQQSNYTEGNLYHSAAVYQAKAGDITYFISGGFSKTDPGGHGMFNDYATSMIMQADGTMVANPDWQPNTDSETGYSIYAGLRYDLPEMGLKLGLEYNYGSEYWLAFNPGHDDLYMAKLAARGHVGEVYMIYDLPTGEAVSEYAKTFIRLGYQHYEYDYTGNDWNTKPYDTDDAAMMTASLNMATESGTMVPVDSADQVYLTLDVFF